MMSCFFTVQWLWRSLVFWYLSHWPRQLVRCTECGPIHSSSANLQLQLKSLIMMTSSNGDIFRVTGHLCGEFPAQRPVTRSFGVFFDLRLNKRLSKQSWGWWFEALSRPLWRQCNVELAKLSIVMFELVHSYACASVTEETMIDRGNIKHNPP